ncbi:Os01g0856332 [Oryza sativa Japonica Group]|uniref:Os01g0856332 protein n=1 Tax=Oryza sativa subsp. japonica TaxID=39947 RepID=A0A0P0VAL2_ORYSJ|nr:Os01g0856332 [Oryza sativa Japonica Group]
MPMPTATYHDSISNGECVHTRHQLRPLPSPVPLLSASGGSRCCHGLDHGSLLALTGQQHVTSTACPGWPLPPLVVYSKSFYYLGRLWVAPIVAGRVYRYAKVVVK